MKRTTICNDGKQRTFSYEGAYYTLENINKEEIFDGFEDCNACVLYTTIKHDKGWREAVIYGTPRIEDYDNGLVGYQNYNFFKDIEEAKKDFENRKKLSTKVGTIGYCDILLIIK